MPLGKHMFRDNGVVKWFSIGTCLHGHYSIERMTAKLVKTPTFKNPYN